MNSFYKNTSDSAQFKMLFVGNSLRIVLTYCVPAIPIKLFDISYKTLGLDFDIGICIYSLDIFI